MSGPVTNGKSPCIWMEAGVVDFKLCNFCFDCPNCEFDRAMTAAAIQSQARCDTGEQPPDQQRRIFPFKERLRQRSFEQLLRDQAECYARLDRPPVKDVFGFAAPSTLYLHRGHTWAALETCGRVRIGLDDFARKVLGPLDEIRLPRPGGEWQRDQVGLHLVRQGRRAAVLAPVDGVIDIVNARVREHPALAYDDPYGEGWLCVVSPTNLKPDLEHLLFGRRNAAWIENEAHRLLGMLESAAGLTLPSGGMIVDDVYGHYPQLQWERLVLTFLRTF